MIATVLHILPDAHLAPPVSPSLFEVRHQPPHVSVNATELGAVKHNFNVLNQFVSPHQFWRRVPYQTS